VSQRRGASGFTLIEVLVALVIVAFGMGAVLTSLTSAADTTLRLREKSIAEWVGLNQLANARLGADMPVNGKSEGDTEFANARWHWQQQVENFDIPGMRRITIRVRHATGNAAAASASAGGDWLATVMGFRGDALSKPVDALPGYSAPAPAPP
jgi:general secretion pathway protein I